MSPSTGTMTKTVDETVDDDTLLAHLAQPAYSGDATLSQDDVPVWALPELHAQVPGSPGMSSSMDNTHVHINITASANHTVDDDTPLFNLAQPARSGSATNIQDDVLVWALPEMHDMSQL